MSHTISTPIRKLQAGDVVWAHGMRLVIDQPIERSTSHPADNGGCYWTKALVTNPDEVREAKVVPFSWLLDHKVGDGQPRWTLQGNDLGTVAVEAHEGGYGCHFKLDPGTTHGAFACGERR